MTITLIQRGIARKKAELGMNIDEIRQLSILEGATPEEINEAVGLCSNTYVAPLRQTKPRDEFKSKIDSNLYPSLNTRIPRELKDDITEFARLEFTNPSIIVRLALQEFLHNHKRSLNPAVQNLIKTK